MSDQVVAADLFCGGGGTSTGFARAVKKAGKHATLTAINCWPKAIETHERNHPWARHICARIEGVRPEDLVPDRHLHMLLASPECIWWSVARGGRPVNDQLRSSPWVVPRWLESLDVEAFAMENVPEFRNWGPLHTHGPKKGKPDKNRKGQIFKQYLQMLRSLDYTVEARVLNAADYGAFTTRRRLFVCGVKGDRAIKWPEPTHSQVDRKTGTPKAKGTKPWRAARDILDFDLPNRSIFDPEKPLAWNTMRRIAIGARKFWGIDLKPYLVKLYGTSTVADLDDPAPTVTSGGGHLGLVEPFIVDTMGGSPDHEQTRLNDGSVPLGAQTGRDRFGAAEALILGQGGGATARETGDPIPTVHGDGHVRVVQPFILPPEGYYRGLSGARTADQPAPTVTSRGASIRLLEPMMMTVDRPRTNRSLPRGTDEPIAVVTGNDRTALLEPFLVPNKGERKGQAPRTRSTQEPLNVVTATGNTGNVVEPLMVEYYGNGKTRPTREPVPTLTARDRVALAIPLTDGRYLDIRFRMLAVKELSAAMGFPSHYEFVGNKGDQVKMIGNAVEVHTAEALSYALLQQTSARGGTTNGRVLPPGKPPASLNAPPRGPGA